MPIIVDKKTTQLNTTVEFNFPGHKVISHTVGLAYWRLSFNNDNHVRALKISLSANKANDTQITVRVSGEIRDDSGNTLYAPDSSVVVCCIALVDNKDSNVVLTNVDGISSGTQSQGIALPNSTPSINAAFLSGFELDYGNDNHVLSLELATGAYASGSTAYITADASMSDSSGNKATTAKLNAGLLAASTTDAVYTKAKTNLQDPTGIVPVEFNKALSDAVVLIQDYQVYFAKDHHVRSIGGGCHTWTVEGNTVRLTNPRSFIWDDSGNTASGNSYVSLLVVGVP